MPWARSFCPFRAYGDKKLGSERAYGDKKLGSERAYGDKKLGSERVYGVYLCSL
jgi:hypothetical protein